MTRPAVDRASHDDEPELRRLMREVSMPGAISVAFEREPDFFLGAGIQGDRVDTLVARQGRRLVGAAGYARRSMYVNGDTVDVGYLNAIRIEPAWRGRRLTPEGLRRLHDIVRAEETPLCFSTLLDDNREARSFVARKAARSSTIPTFEPLERFSTLLMSVSRRRSGPAGIRVGSAERSDVGAIVACLARHGRRKQFAVAWTRENLLDAERTRDLAVDDFFVAREGESVVGCVALWDQSAFKQSVVSGYERPSRLGRIAFNGVAPWFGRPRLPEPGGAFPHAYLSHLAVDDDDEAVTLALIAAARERCRSRVPFHLCLGIAARDPRCSVIERYFRAMSYRSSLCLVVWPHQRAAVDRLDGRLPHPEVATL